MARKSSTIKFSRGSNRFSIQARNLLIAMVKHGLDMDSEISELSNNQVPVAEEQGVYPLADDATVLDIMTTILTSHGKGTVLCASHKGKVFNCGKNELTKALSNGCTPGSPVESLLHHCEVYSDDSFVTNPQTLGDLVAPWVE